MDTCQMTAMAEATRLTRQGRLVEATALIQQTLAGPAVTRRTTDAPSAGEENDSTPDHHPNVAGTAARPQGEAAKAGHSRLDSPFARFPQPGRIRSRPRPPACGPGCEAVGGPV